LRQHALEPLFSVLSDHEQIGKIQWQYIGAMLGEEGTVLYIEGPDIEGPGGRDVAKTPNQG